MLRLAGGAWRAAPAKYGLPTLNKNGPGAELNTGAQVPGSGRRGVASVSEVGGAEARQRRLVCGAQLNTGPTPTRATLRHLPPLVEAGR